MRGINGCGTPIPVLFEQTSQGRGLGRSVLKFRMPSANNIHLAGVQARIFGPPAPGEDELVRMKGFLLFIQEEQSIRLCKPEREIVTVQGDGPIQITQCLAGPPAPHHGNPQVIPAIRVVGMQSQ